MSNSDDEEPTAKKRLKMTEAEKDEIAIKASKKRPTSHSPKSVQQSSHQTNDSVVNHITPSPPSLGDRDNIEKKEDDKLLPLIGNDSTSWSVIPSPQSNDKKRCLDINDDSQVKVSLCMLLL
jgi:hypothetical protein